MIAKLIARVQARLRAVRAGRDAGFTILEVLVAFTLFVLASTTATYALFTSINTSHLSQQRGTAAGVAQSYIAQAANNAATIGQESAAKYSATVGSEDFSVLRTIKFSGSNTKCAEGVTFTVNVEVDQAQTNKFLARNDSVIAC